MGRVTERVNCFRLQWSNCLCWSGIAGSGRFSLVDGHTHPPNIFAAANLGIRGGKLSTDAFVAVLPIFIGCASGGTQWLTQSTSQQRSGHLALVDG
jgi:hypothetical protein